MSLVSVVTTTCGRPTLRRALESVQHQTCSDVSSIVVTEEKFNLGAISMIVSDYSKSKLVVANETNIGAWINDENGPATICRAIGANTTDSKYIAFLDDDNWYEKNHLETLVGLLEANAHIGFALSSTVIEDARPGHSGTYLRSSKPFLRGQLDMSEIVVRRSVWENFGQMQPTDGHAPDWMMVERWLIHGVIGVRSPLHTLHYERWRD